MIYFSASVLEFLIVGALALTGAAAIILLLMVLVDFLRKRVW